MKKMTLLLLLSIIYTCAHAQAKFEKFELNSIGGSFPSAYTIFDNKLFFYANDGINGQEMWYTEGGDTLSFHMLQNISPSNDALDHLGYPGSTIVINNKLVFAADDGTGNEIWTYDGINPAIQAEDLDVTVPFRPRGFVQLDTLVYFTGNVGEYLGQGMTSWVPRLFSYNTVTNKSTQCTPLTIHALIGTMSFNGSRSLLVPFKGKIYFVANDSSAGLELHSYTPGSTTATLVADINPGTDSSSPSGLLVHDGKLYFFAKSPAYGIELWSYDGTNPPVRITDLNPGPASAITNDSSGAPNLLINATYYMGSYRGQVYFTATDGVSGEELYRYNPATGTVSMVQDLLPGPGSSMPIGLVIYNDFLYFRTGKESQHIWRYDGSNPPVKVLPDSGSRIVFNYSNAIVFDGSMYLSLSEGFSTNGELYRYTDTTLAPPPDTTDTTTHVNIISLKGKVTAYPNPAHSSTTLEVSLQEAQSFAIILTDVYGRVVHTIAKKQYNTEKHNITIPMQTLPAGIYYYHIANGTAQLATGKVMKE